MSRQVLIGWPRSSFFGSAEQRNGDKFWFADVGLNMSKGILGLIWLF